MGSQLHRTHLCLAAGEGLPGSGPRGGVEAVCLAGGFVGHPVADATGSGYGFGGAWIVVSGALWVEKSELLQEFHNLRIGSGVHAVSVGVAVAAGSWRVGSFGEG